MAKTKRIQLITESAVNVLVLYQFLKLLTKPFEEWKAFKLGIIDKDGNSLRKRATLDTAEEKSSFDLFHLFVRNIKRLIEKFPGGKSKLATYLAGLFLLKEEKNASWYEDEDVAYEAFMDFYESNEDDEALYKELRALVKKHYPDCDLDEDAPANAVGTGAHVAGLTEPVVRCPPGKKRKKFKNCV